MTAASPPCPPIHAPKPLTLGAISSSPRTARMAARSWLSEWGLIRLADSVELIVSELVTNAVHASASYQVPSPVQFRMSATRNIVLVEVWDRDPSAPILRDALDLDETGRGLLLVASTSSRWGWTEFNEGKVVWAEVTESGRIGNHDRMRSLQA